LGIVFAIADRFVGAALLAGGQLLVRGQKRRHVFAALAATVVAVPRLLANRVLDGPAHLLLSSMHILRMRVGPLKKSGRCTAQSATERSRAARRTAEPSLRRHRIRSR